MIFWSCTHAEQHQELPLAEVALCQTNSVCCACHLLDEATNTFFISKVVTGRNSSISLPPDGSGDPDLWANSCRNKMQICPSGRQLTSLTGVKQAFPHHFLIPLVTKIQCPQSSQKVAHLQNTDCITTRAIPKRKIYMYEKIKLNAYLHE